MIVRPSGVSPEKLGVSVKVTSLPTSSVPVAGERLLAILTSEPSVTSVVVVSRLLLVMRSGGLLLVISPVTVISEVEATAICPFSCRDVVAPTAMGPATVQR